MRAMPAPWGECPGRRRRSWRAWRRRRCARHRLPPIHRPSAWRRRFRPCGQPHRPPAVRQSQDRQGRGSRGIGLAIRRRGPPLESATVAGLMPSAWRRRSAAFRCVRWAALSRDSSAILGSPSPLTGGVAGAVSGPVSPLGWPLASVLLDPRLSILGGPGALPRNPKVSAPFTGKAAPEGCRNQPRVVQVLAFWRLYPVMLTYPVVAEGDHIYTQVPGWDLIRETSRGGVGRYAVGLGSKSRGGACPYAAMGSGPGMRSPARPSSPASRQPAASSPLASSGPARTARPTCRWVTGRCDAAAVQGRRLSRGR